MNVKACNNLGGHWDFNNKICNNVHIRPRRTKEMEKALKKYFSYSSLGTPEFETEKERFTERWSMSPGYMKLMWDSPYEFKVGQRVVVRISSGNGIQDSIESGKFKRKGKRGSSIFKTYVVTLDNGMDVTVTGHEIMKAPRGL